jgi:zinc transporter ZupT
MEILFSVILFISAFIPGYWIIRKADRIHLDLHYLLVFAGAYIFSITIVHLLPEIITHSEKPTTMGIFVLVGFFMQIFLDFLTKGVEHGHVHTHTEANSSISPVTLMIGLTIHALMDGAILVHPDHHPFGLLLGIVLHKVPAAIVLVSVLLTRFKSRFTLLLLLLLFSLSSPTGFIINNYLSTSGLMSQEILLVIFAIVSGNFLHISTTIYYESSPDHKYHRKKILVGLLGALFAIAVELFHA